MSPPECTRRRQKGDDEGVARPPAHQASPFAIGWMMVPICERRQNQSELPIYSQDSRAAYLGDHPREREFLMRAPRRPFRADRLREARLVLGRARVRVRQILGLILGCLLVLAFADDDVRLAKVVPLGDFDAGDFARELFRVLRLFDALASPGTLQGRRRSQRWGRRTISREVGRTQPGSVRSSSFGASASSSRRFSAAKS